MSFEPQPFQTAALFLIVVGWIAILLSGCGGAPEMPSPLTPRVVVSCDETSCTLLVHDADTITVWYDDRFYWSVDDVFRGRRYTVRDAAPESSYFVEACNEYGCTEHEELL